METIVLKATNCTVIGKKVGALRRAGKLPGVIYGHHIEPTPILLDLHEASLILATITGTSPATVDVEGTILCSCVRKQRNFVKNILTHIDFQAVSLTEKIRARVNIEFHGVAPAVKNFNGVVVTGINNIEVEALPQSLPERIIVDISELMNIGDGIYIRDLKVASDVIIHDSQEEMIVVITAPAAEEVSAEEAASAAEPEVIEKGKKEEEEA